MALASITKNATIEISPPLCFTSLYATWKIIRDGNFTAGIKTFSLIRITRINTKMEH